MRRLCEKAKLPIRADILEALGMPGVNRTTGAICVYHEMVEPTKRFLSGSGIPVAAVSTCFPTGLSPLELGRKDTEASVAADASEIDIVISRCHVLT